MANTSSSRSMERGILILTSIVTGLAVIGALYWAQRVFIPVAMAVYFTFLLSPVVAQFHRLGLGRIPSVLAVTLLTLTVGLCVLWLVGDQVMALARDLPNYTNTVKKKIEHLQQAGEGSVFERLDTMRREIAGTVQGQPGATATPDRPIPVVVEQGDPAWLNWLPGSLSSGTEMLGQVGLVAILAIFMLLQREDMRNRFIRLVGYGRMTLTTKAVDDASQRLSRFLLMQLLVNGAFGICFGIGLRLIGVEYAVLWGLLAAILRYVPYVGTPIAAVFPLMLSLIQFEGWLPPLLVLGLLAVLELSIANAVEPLLYGSSTGVSAVALLVAAAFWAFLWGPVGLVLSCPLTVCMVVLGKYVPYLEFLSVLLGDEPALAEDITYYQRLSAHDQDEASRIVHDYATTKETDQVYDNLLVPALVYTTRDHERGGLDDNDLTFARQATREVLDDLVELRAKQQKASKNSKQPADARPLLGTKVRIVGVCSRDESDELALDMLGHLLEGEECTFEVLGHETLSSELLTVVEKQAPAAVCIGSLPPGGLAHARYLCKRLRARFPDLKILVGRWGVVGAAEENRASLVDAGADLVSTTLADTRTELLAWLPALAQNSTEPPSGGNKNRPENLVLTN